MEYPAIHLYTKTIQVTSGIFNGYTTWKDCTTILYHAIENTVARWEDWVWYSQVALIDGKVWLNTNKYMMAFLQSDWLYFVWHGINVLYRTDNITFIYFYLFTNFGRTIWQERTHRTIIVPIKTHHQQQ